MEHVLISACLLGLCCRYDGRPGRELPQISRLMECCHLIPVCPEQLGGLATPRTPSEIQGERVVSQDGRDVTEAYEKGAGEALKVAQMFGCRYALLKERSPSCGSGMIYDGRFQKQLIFGDGIAAGCIKKHGIRVWGESQAEDLIQVLKASESA